MAVHHMPTSIAASPAVFVQMDIALWLHGLPNGASFSDPTIAVFPAGRIFGIRHRIVLHRKQNFVVVMNGSELWHSSGHDDWLDPAFLMVYCQNCQIHGGTMRGQFHLVGIDSITAPTRGAPGTIARSQGAVTALQEGEREPSGGNQSKAGVGVYGGANIWITDMRVEHVYGDGIVTALGWLAWPQDGVGSHKDLAIPGGWGETHFQGGDGVYVGHPLSGGDWREPLTVPTNVYVYDFVSDKVARHGLSPNEIDGFFADNFLCRDSWYYGMDAEADDGFKGTVRNIHLSNGTFHQYAFGALTVPVACLYCDDFSVRGVKVLGEQTVTSWAPFWFEIYTLDDNLTGEDSNTHNSNFIHDILIEECEIHRYQAHGVWFGNVDTAVVRNNKDVHRHPQTPNFTPFYKNSSSPSVNRFRAVNLSGANNTTTTVPATPVAVTRVQSPLEAAVAAGRYGTESWQAPTALNVE